MSDNCSIKKMTLREAYGRIPSVPFNLKIDDQIRGQIFDLKTVENIILNNPFLQISLTEEVLEEHSLLHDSAECKDSVSMVGICTNHLYLCDENKDTLLPMLIGLYKTIIPIVDASGEIMGYRTHSAFQSIRELVKQLYRKHKLIGEIYEYINLDSKFESKENVAYLIEKVKDSDTVTGINAASDSFYYQKLSIELKNAGETLVVMSKDNLSVVADSLIVNGFLDAGCKVMVVSHEFDPLCYSVRIVL